MKVIPITNSEKANISIDFLAAVAILLLAFLFAITTINNMMTPYSGYTKELYPTADRAISLLMEDEGYWYNISEGTDWESEWNKNYSNVKKIGFLKNKENHVLDANKMSIFMESHSDSTGTWWEYPPSSSQNSEVENATRAMGLERYYYYIQIRPLDMSIDEKADADQNAIEMVGDRGDSVSVVRYGRVDLLDFGDFDGANILGHQIPTKPLFGVDKEFFQLIKSNGGLRFTIFNWSVLDENAEIQFINIGEDLNSQYEITIPRKLKDDQFNISKNNVSSELKLSITNSNDSVTIEIPIETLYEEIPNWDIGDNIFYIQFNVKNLNVSDTGITWFNSSISGENYPVKAILWVW